MPETTLPNNVEARCLRYAEWLGALVDLPLTEMWRPLGQDFDFGALDEEGSSPYTLRLLQDWRVAREGLVILGSSDHLGRRGARRFYDRVTPPRDRRERDRWLRAKAFLQEVEAGKLVVSAVTVSSVFEPRLTLGDGTTIEAAHTTSDPRTDLWWFGTPTHSALVVYSGDTGLSLRQDTLELIES